MPFGINEAQLCSPLFPALKQWVRTNKAKEQFILSGSVRFTSKADIRESLTGRIISLELLPFTIAESAQLALASPPQAVEMDNAPGVVRGDGGQTLVDDDFIVLAHRERALLVTRPTVEDADDVQILKMFEARKAPEAFPAFLDLEVGIKNVQPVLAPPRGIQAHARAWRGDREQLLCVGANFPPWLSFHSK